jgi:hypothetical protein
MASKGKIEIVWEGKPHPDLILWAQLTLLGWSESEIRESLERERLEAIEEKRRGQAGESQRKRGRQQKGGRK